MAPTKIWAHRGESAHHLENTLEAFHAAVAAGADGIELDVRRCASGEAVVFHDATLERLAGRPEAVASLSLARLRAVRLGGGSRIPTLVEALEATGSLEVNVELKVDGWRPTGVEAAAVEAIRRAGAQHRVLVSSFHPLALLRLRRLAPRLRRALLFDGAHPTACLAPVLGVEALHPDDRLVTRRHLQRWRHLAPVVNVWTVDEAARARQLAAWGVDGLITNDPARIRDALMGL
ncbi:MAG: glycerophosphodiester phosphodiesterase [Deltaproteobacteria bacterium]|nr:MAG: glycerophosphodiester phosphodiesterase [Deltaproteobacteria bacterium]